ncbi:hypothetical protein GGG16DRAFT_67351 [Schizophyllum commune]
MLTSGIVDDFTWLDFLHAEFDIVQSSLLSRGLSATAAEVRDILEARYRLISADPGLHGDSILSSVDENSPEWRRRCSITFHYEGEAVCRWPSSPSFLTLDLWKTGGWIILSHFEITLQAFGIRDALAYPHVRLRNGAIQGYEWDARIPVAGDHLDIYPMPQKPPEVIVTVYITIKDEFGMVQFFPFFSLRHLTITQADSSHSMVPAASRSGAWVVPQDHLVVLLHACHAGRCQHRLMRRVPENGTFVPCLFEEPIPVASGDHLRLAWQLTPLSNPADL